MGNAVVPLAILAGSGALVYVGITDPEGGAFAGLARLMRGEPQIKRSPDPAAFVSVTRDLAKIGNADGSGNGIFTLPPDAPTPTGVRAKVLAEARTWIGVPYRWGGNTRLGVDCSGLTTQVYAKAAGVTLPRVSAAQALFGRPRTMATAQPGDLICFARSGVVHHVGIYIGANQIIHSPHPGTRVRVETIWTGETVIVRDVLTKAAARKHRHHTTTPTSPSTGTRGTAIA